MMDSFRLLSQQEGVNVFGSANLENNWCTCFESYNAITPFQRDVYTVTIHSHYLFDIMNNSIAISNMHDIVKMKIKGLNIDIEYIDKTKIPLLQSIRVYAFIHFGVTKTGVCFFFSLGFPMLPFIHAARQPGHYEPNLNPQEVGFKAVPCYW